VLKISGNYPEAYTHYEIKNRLFAEYSEKIDKIVMFGDSITEGVAWNELLGISGIANRGIGGDITEGFLNRLSDIYKLNPEMCFIMGGINDIRKGIPLETIIRNMERIISALEGHGIKVIIQSTLYVAKNYDKWKEINSKVKELNTWLERYCEERGIIYIDINRALADADALRKEYTYDGVHLLGSGYKIWGKMIMTIIEDEEKE
jgi:lysophospholipase L1-like esterase